MKALRDLLDHPPRGPQRVLPSVAVLSAVARPVLEPDLTTSFDRVRFGCSVDDVQALENEQLHLMELVWEALEAASIPLDELTQRSIGLCVATAIDVAPVHDWLGVAGSIDRFAATPLGVLSAIERAVSNCTSSDAQLIVAPLDTGLAVFVVATGVFAATGARVGRVASWSRGRSVEEALRHCRAHSLLDAPKQVPVVDAGVLFQALAGTGAVEFAAGSGHEAVALHVVHDVPAAENRETPRLLRLSSSSRSGLRDLVAQVVLRLQSDTDLRSIAVDASRRAPLERRIAVPTRNLDAVGDRLGAWLAGDRDAVAVDKYAGADVAFVFPPAGSQYANMAGSLYDTEPAFREAVMACDRLLRRQLPRPLLSLMFPQPGREHPLADPMVASPLTFVVGWSLSRLLASWDVVPRHVIGCGVGEVVAGVVAGAISLEDGLKLSVERGRLLRQVVSRGERVVLTGSEEQARELIEGLEGLDVVAVPVPHKAVVGGDLDAVQALIERANAKKISVERVGGHPGHTPLVDPLLDAYRAVAATTTSRVPECTWVSTSTGAVVDTAVTPEHWVGSLRSTLRFAVACEVAYFGGTRTFLELSPRPVMVGAGRRTLAHLPSQWVSALSGPDGNDRDSLNEALAVLWSRGVEMPPASAARGQGAPLPLTTWDRRPLDERPEPAASLRAPTLVPDEETPAPVPREVAPLPVDGFAPPIAPPSMLDDFSEGDVVNESEDPDISTFFGDDLPVSAAVVPAPALEVPIATGFLREAWPLVEAPKAADMEPATWIVLVDEEGVGDYLLSLLHEAGHRGFRVLESPPYPRNDGTLFVPEPSAPGAWDEVIDHLGTLNGPVRVVHLWALDHRRHGNAWLALVRLVETFKAYGVSAPMYVVSRGLFGKEPSQSAALLWGVGRRMAVEAPRQWGGAIDLDEDEDAEALLAHLLERGAPAEVAFSGAKRRRRVLEPVDVNDDAVWNTDDSWVVVGSADPDTLGLVRALGQLAVKKVVLISAEAPTSDVTMAVLGLHKVGVRCTIVRGDVSNRDDHTNIMERLSREVVSGVLVRVAGSKHAVLPRAGDVGLRQVKALDGLPFALGLAEQRIVWMPVDALEEGDSSPWATVLAPAVVQQASDHGASVVCGDTDEDAALQLLRAVHPGEVLVGRSTKG